MPQETIAASDRGLSYGDGLFETIAVVNSRPRLLNAHLARLEKGLQRLRFPVGTLALVKEDLARLDFQGDQTLKITVTRGSGARGYAIPDPLQPSRILSLSPARQGMQLNRERGVRARLCQFRLGLNPALAQLKHLNRLEQVMARSEWDDPDVAEGIVCDLEGNLVEGTMSNLFWRQGSHWYTPDLSCCGVQGVMRDHLLGLFGKQGVVVEQGRYPAEVLTQADELFLCNSLIGIWPVTEFEAQRYEIGETVRRLQSVLSEDLHC
ncbi:aminodeoxychorismate lyase [Neptuniibacter halophilus]|uniref:aminodeoxychorismate lyase n=1 Tax=Neptuniibacter halophilus TaxID=651666 RepID=UPI00257417C1|nr:aminodeoxychorismate lyase [Neptuniibacter halophilus]